MKVAFMTCLFPVGENYDAAAFKQGANGEIKE